MYISKASISHRDRVFGFSSNLFWPLSGFRGVVACNSEDTWVYDVCVSVVIFLALVRFLLFFLCRVVFFMGSVGWGPSMGVRLAAHLPQPRWSCSTASCRSSLVT